MLRIGRGAFGHIESNAGVFGRSAGVLAARLSEAGMKFDRQPRHCRACQNRNLLRRPPGLRLSARMVTACCQGERCLAISRRRHSPRDRHAFGQLPRLDAMPCLPVVQSRMDQARRIGPKPRRVLQSALAQRAAPIAPQAAFRRNYPMVAPNYAATRSRLAKQIGLGRQRRRRKAAPDRTCRRRPICSVSYAAAASAARASERMRSTMERKPLERCGVRCSRKPMLSNSLIASVTRMSLAALPE